MYHEELTGQPPAAQDRFRADKASVRAAIYVRISYDRTGAGLGVTRQEDDCRELCQRKGWQEQGVKDFRARYPRCAPSGQITRTGKPRWRA
jgi:hypothetical protein